MCIENLTPWLKLLPCRDKAGIASLLYRPSIYKGYYHSQKLKLRSSKSLCIILDQTLTVVLQPNTGFLHIDEYPPDANQGFDIPSALVSFPEFSSARSYPEIDPVLGSPLLQNFQKNGYFRLQMIIWLMP
ncbi:unnamed protein product [Miscanthus lutarioriparius]|uniref:Uncharacterized protein n=1 Tax=Miscanthus lutarioriparius TaxID=422564 RepID=A0A811Q4Z5_9POAL|nr:unnamed protein product [Miscanthus lutarioriparius]